MFVPAGMGKKVRVNDDVEISPDTIRRHEHGFGGGKVLAISEIPSTELAMIAELKHKTLVSSFVGQYAGQVLLSIRVKLLDVREIGGASAGTGAGRLSLPCNGRRRRERRSGCRPARFARPRSSSSAGR